LPGFGHFFQACLNKGIHSKRINGNIRFTRTQGKELTTKHYEAMIVQDARALTHCTAYTPPASHQVLYIQAERRQLEEEENI